MSAHVAHTVQQVMMCSFSLWQCTLLICSVEWCASCVEAFLRLLLGCQVLVVAIVMPVLAVIVTSGCPGCSSGHHGYTIGCHGYTSGCHACTRGCRAYINRCNAENAGEKEVCVCGKQNTESKATRSKDHLLAGI